MSFAPIAIVGRACVLPGALSPEALWQAVASGRDLISTTPAGRWRLAAEHALCAPDAPKPDRTWSDRGGYVDGFAQIWNPHGFAIPAEELAELDPLVHWLLHCSRLALRQLAGDSGSSENGPASSDTRVGAIFGNLGFPSESMAAFADQVWKGASGEDPRNRYMSGGSAAVLTRALNLAAGSHALDAACASSLYAIKLACDRLHEGSADVMLAGAVQRADDLFLHIGFSALNALSRSGRSRPFHRDADGLVPAEGCAMLALKRLADARRDGDTVYAIVRGIGLSNDGRGKGLLVPDEAGQQRALRGAYVAAGLKPNAVSLLECHATGTPVGDATEIRSSAAVFDDVVELPVGSLKSNLGHLITVAGAAGIIKLIEAMRAGVRPPSLHAEVLTPALAHTPFRVLHTAEKWPSATPRIAAISAFGFGGNNAHLILSEDDPDLRGTPPVRMREIIAITGIGCIAGSAPDRAAFTAALFSDQTFRNASGAGAIDQIELDLAGLRFPPRDLQQTLPQQLAMLEATRDALCECGPLPRDRSAVLIGMEPDAEVARYGTRWRMAMPASGSSHAVESVPSWIHTAQNAVIAPLESAGVIGCMPNIPANRISAQFDLAGPAFTVQAGAASGLHALRIACHALAHHEIDAALVGAVDLCCEAVTRASGNTDPADAAVAIVVKRLVDAERDGNRIYALLETAGTGPQLPFCETSASAMPDTIDEIAGNLGARLGNAGAADGLLHLTAAAISLHHRRHVGGRPWLSAQQRRLRIPLPAAATMALSEATTHARRGESSLPRLRVYSAADQNAVIAALQANRPGNNGPARLVLVCRDEEFEAMRTRALAHLQHGAPAGSSIHFRAAPIDGQLAFVFAGAGAAYAGMGADLVTQLPQLLPALAERSQHLATSLNWAFDPDLAQPTALQQLWGASALSQLHLELSEGVLGLHADAWLGYSSGETNALVAAGVWNDPDALMDEMQASGLVTHHLGGDFSAVREQWNRPVRWASWTVLAPVAEVHAALHGIERVHLAIINGDADCLIAGEECGCELLVERIGSNRCLRLIYPLAVHVPELAAMEAEWLLLHRRETRAPRHGKVYSNALGSAYTPDRESCARAILDQANRTLDLRPVVLRAWQDGVRIFIEHGPGSTFARAIRGILGKREALVVSLDRKGQGIEGTLGAIAALLAAGVPMRNEHLHDLLSPVPTKPAAQRPLRLPAHWPPVVLMQRGNAAAEAMTAQMQTMPRAPSLPSTLSTEVGVGVAVAAAPIGPPSTPVVFHALATLPAERIGTHRRAPPLAAQRAQIAHASRVHQQFLDLQSNAHQQYLQLRQQAQQLLLRVGTGGSGRRFGATPLPASLSAAPTAPAFKPERTVQTLPSRPANAPPRITVAQSVVHAAERELIAPVHSKPTIDAAAQHKTQHHAVTGPSFNREQLLMHADGRISDLFGAQFTAQDQYLRQVRMPKPPLLLADRVLGISGKPGGMGLGHIWTETDVGSQDWYLHNGFMPAGVMIEAGQADLMLISWLGADAHNRGERVYRLLGCELTYHGDLPQRGDTLRFDIALDGHAAQGDVRLMFFHYDCDNGDRKQLSVRKGQAGFFSDAELAESAGCLWTPEQQAIVANPQLDPPVLTCTRNALDRDQIEAFAAGDAARCFGPGFEFAQTHTRSPSIAQGGMLLLDRITHLEIDGGPWQRGYLRAELDISAQQWFFDGHFKNDPCMPGTLMFDGCLQAMALYLAACGYTLKRDGWRFQPVPELPYQLQCRGQVTPGSRLLVTEVFIEERSAGPVPTV
ncbi:MAG: beta-ketoacyl synthase N-terminal-like domain-containing protein, partial [Pseudomonadota bacterium]|nr:beta-ketoacyl synthase N-terminal-like domain-containing protein [Pseudomonadota bacterium]